MSITTRYLKKNFNLQNLFKNYIEDTCLNLVCKQHRDANMCHATSIGAAEGTSCGKGKWCENGKCVKNIAAPKSNLLSS